MLKQVMNAKMGHEQWSCQPVHHTCTKYKWWYQDLDYKSYYLGGLDYKSYYLGVISLGLWLPDVSHKSPMNIDKDRIKEKVEKHLKELMKGEVNMFSHVLWLVGTKHSIINSLSIEFLQAYTRSEIISINRS